MSYCVFQYETEINIEDVRKSLVDMVFRCLESNKPITKAEFYARIPKLLCGSYPERAGKSVKASLDALLWKYSELTGKYCGCQYWSVKAKALFDEHLDRYLNGRFPTPGDARKIVRVLQKKSQDYNQRIVHEHVFPRAQLVRLLMELKVPPAKESLDKLMRRLATGCVVLGSEDNLLDKYKGNCDNPWLRYKGLIKLAENKKWEPLHQDLIKKAELL
jgi:hypothetical protein